MDDNADLVLMRRVAEGDEAAMAELVGRWQKPVLAFVFRFLQCSEDDARDVGQDVFLRVWRERRRWRPTAAFSTWLFTIVANLCRNRRRDAGRRSELTTVPAVRAESLRGGSVEVPDPHAGVEAKQLQRRVRAAVAGLPDAQRAAVLLRHFNELSYREIAAVLGTTPSAVDSLLVRARRTLAKSLREVAQESGGSGVER